VLERPFNTNCYGKMALLDVFVLRLSDTAVAAVPCPIGKQEKTENKEKKRKKRYWRNGKETLEM